MIAFNLMNFNGIVVLLFVNNLHNPLTTRHRFFAFSLRFFVFSSSKDDQEQYDSIGKQLEKTKKNEAKRRNINAV